MRKSKPSLDDGFPIKRCPQRRTERTRRGIQPTNSGEDAVVEKPFQVINRRNRELRPMTVVVGRSNYDRVSCRYSKIVCNEHGAD